MSDCDVEKMDNLPIMDEVFSEGYKEAVMQIKLFCRRNVRNGDTWRMLADELDSMIKES